MLGSPGAGKTQLGARLGAILGLPVIDLDDEHWQAGWVEPPDEWWAQRQRELVAEERWVLAGNYGGTVDIRAERADLVVLMDLPRWLCVWRLVLRSLKIRVLRQTWRMPVNCRDGPDWEPVRDYPEFARYTWRFPDVSRPRVLEQLHEAGTTRMIHLSSSRAVRDLEAAITSASDPAGALRAAEVPLPG